MKILFIVPNTVGDKYAATAPPPGVSYLASFLMKNNHEVKAIDMRVEPEMKSLYESIDNFKPDYIGISFMSIDYKQVYSFINNIKKKYDIPLILGGAHTSTIQEVVLKETNADMAVFGEGEITFLELLDGKEIKEIDGLIWRDNEKIIRNKEREFMDNLDELPFPAYDLFPLEKYVDKKIPIVSSRGCPYQCVFCAMKKIMGAKWRPRSAENVVAEIEHWNKKGYKFFHIVDDNFTLDMKRAEKICDLILEKGLDVKWDLRNGVRVDRVDENLLRKMKQAGCYFLAYGIEAVDDEVLTAMKKGTNFAAIKKAVETTEKVGIPMNGFFMIGLPKSTFKTFMKSYNFAKSHSFEEVKFYNTIPYPKTELYEALLKENRLKVGPSVYLNDISNYSNDPLYATPEFPSLDRKKAFKMGHSLAMKKQLRKEFGPALGKIAYYVYFNKFLHKLLVKPGIIVWKAIRRKKTRK